jgi:hypothetical protein
MVEVIITVTKTTTAFENLHHSEADGDARWSRISQF